MFPSKRQGTAAGWVELRPQVTPDNVFVVPKEVFAAEPSFYFTGGIASNVSNVEVSIGICVILTAGC